MVPTTATATMCPSPPLPTISPLLRTTHQCQPSPSSSTPSSIKLGTTLFSSEATVDESSVTIKPVKWGSQLEKRRKKRRRRRAGLDPEEEENVVPEVETEPKAVSVHVGASRSGFLSRLEEVQLCFYLKEGAILENLETSVEENEMVSLLMKGKKKRSANEILYRRREAREKITRCYRRLVVSIATGYQGKGLNLQDLIQEGSIGLLRGAERFDPERGYKLSTYVYWWIKQAILRAIAHKSRLVKLPGSMWELTAKVAEASNVLSRKLRRIPSSEEIADHLNIHVSAVRLAVERSRSPVSLDRVLSHNGRMTLQEIVRGPDETRPEEMVRKEHMKHEIKQLLGTLTARESRVLGLYFGLNGETPMSFEEIGKKLKLSRERVRQINGIALTKLRSVHNILDRCIMSKTGSLDLASNLGGNIDKSDVLTAVEKYEQYHVFHGGDEEERKANYTDMVNKYYDLATSFYEYGWGESFHFAHRWKGESLRESIKRHEHFLALQLGVKPGQKVLDVGCGIGGPLREIARFSNSSVTGLNNNEYQITRGKELNRLAGVDKTCNFVKYGCYKEIFRVLKPGQCFAAYEWCMTDAFDPSNAQHQKIKAEIEIGDGLPDIRLTSKCLEALKQAGFEVIWEKDLAEDSPVPWYLPLDKNHFSLSSFRLTAVGRFITKNMVKVLEYIRLAPKGSQRVSDFLEKAAEGLVDGGRREIFTPMYFFLARKPDTRFLSSFCHDPIQKWVHLDHFHEQTWTSDSSSFVLDILKDSLSQV
ncbi:hypothetical protein IGI04_004745, partial [Brassica rapa subsp. trilocularis]